MGRIEWYERKKMGECRADRDIASPRRDDSKYDSRVRVIRIRTYP